MMMAVATLLMTSCTADDVVRKTTSEEAIPISFSYNYDNEEKNITRAGHQGLMNIEDLYTTGFGVMASLTAGTEAPYDNKPNMMYNQKVEFTFVGDMVNPLKGYWSYQPVKYWPTDLEHCYISAYAPYQELPIADPETTTGIYGLSTNSKAPYVDYRRCEKPNEVVDLMWYYKDFGESELIPAAGTLKMKMHHALARLEIKVAMASAPASGTKMLIENITLTGQMTKTGRLHLYEQKTEGSGNNIKYYPVWSNQTYDLDHTIEITNKDNDAGSYGIIDSQVRYIKGLPYAWQPEGLSTTAQNALSTGDRQGYVYLIPQDELNLTVTVKYHQMTEGSDKKTTTSSTLRIPKPTEEVPNPPLKGNTTYTLNVTLKEITG